MKNEKSGVFCSFSKKCPVVFIESNNILHEIALSAMKIDFFKFGI